MTCLGINNEGYLRYDYYHEDLGQNDAVGQTHVYNGYDSVLWNNFSKAFAEEIQQTYASWRSGDAPLLSYDNVIKYFITNQSDKWSISIYNEDAEYKYISLYRNNDNPEFLYQVKGTGEEHLKYFIKNRLMYCDSKWHTGDFINKDTNTILMRLNAPKDIVDDEIKPDMTIKFKTFSNMYAGVRYGTNGVLNSVYTDRGDLVEVKMPEGEDPNNLDTYIFGASEISELEDLSLLYANLINLSAASKLTKAIIGNSHPNYKNDVLKNISFSNNRLLKEVNICNCTGLTSIIDFSLCPDIQYIYATGSNISGVQLPDSGFVKILRLPKTVSNITLVNQHHIEEFMCEGYSNLTTIKIENSENVPMQDILLGCDSSVLASVSIKNVDWNADSEDNLRIIIDKLIACKGSVIEGSVYLPSGTTVSDGLKVRIHQNFPNLNVIDDNPVFYVDYYNYDNTIWDTEMVKAGNDAVGPSKGEPNDIIQELQGLRHLFVQWKALPTNVNKNCQVDAIWQTQYAVKYYSEDELLYDYWVNQGDTAKDPIDYDNIGLEDAIPVPEKEGTDDLHYVFNSWDSLPTDIQKPTVINAVFDNVYPVRYYATKSSTIPHWEQWIKDGDSAYEPISAGECSAPSDIITENEKKLVFSNWDNIPENVTSICKVYAEYNTYWAARFLNDGVLYLLEWVLEGENVIEPKDYFTDYVDPTRQSTKQYDYHFSKWDGNFKAITEARDYNAIYSSTIRKYNVYFYNDINDTEPLQTIENVQYGSSAKYTGSTPVKSGVSNPEEYEFKGWMPEPTDITGETKCYALFKFTGYIKDDWATIAANAENGMAPYVYQIGGRKEIPIVLDGEDKTIDVEIVAFGHDYLADGSATASITFFCKDLPDIQHYMNNNGTNEGGWEESDMREFVNGKLFDALPDDLKAVILPVHKISDGGSSNKTLITTTDKCWLASYNEVHSTDVTVDGLLPGQGKVYGSVFSKDNSSRKKYITNDTQLGRWWVRSSYYGGSGASFWRVRYDTGGIQTEGAYVPRYVAFGFCIGKGGNLYQFAEDIDSTGIYNNGLGYKNNTYLSTDNVDGTIDGGTTDSIVSTGAMKYTCERGKLPPTIIVKGAEWQNISMCRIRYLSSNKRSTMAPWVSGSNIQQGYSVETLGDKHFKLVPKMGSNGIWAGGGGAAIGNSKYIRMSLVGCGENLNITFEEND